MTADRKATLFVVVAVIAGTVMDALLKQAGQTIATGQLLCLRWMFALLVFLPALRHSASGGIQVHSYKVHITRGVLNGIGSYALLYALATLPLSLVISILFAEPLFIIPIAVLLLGEKVTSKDVACACLGIVGVLIMSQPSAAQGDWRVLLPVLSATCFALLNVLTKKWGRNESPLSLMWWLAVSTLVMTAPFAVGGWKPLVWQDYGLVALIAVAGAIYSFFWIVGLRQGHVAKLTQISFLSLPLAYAAGWLFFDEPPSARLLLGGGVILAAVLLASVQLPRLRLALKN